MKNGEFDRIATILDIVFKLVAVLGISIPLILFYLQTCNDKKDKKLAHLSNVFIEASTDLNRSIVNSLKTDAFETSNLNLRYKYNTLLALYCDGNVQGNYANFLETYKAFYWFKELAYYCDSIFHYQMDLFSNYSLNMKYPYKQRDIIKSNISKFRKFTLGYALAINEINDSIELNLKNSTIDSVTYNTFMTQFDYNIGVNSLLDTRVFVFNMYLDDSTNNEFFLLEKFYFDKVFEKHPEESIFYQTVTFKTMNDSLYTLARKNLLERFELVRSSILNKICK